MDIVVMNYATATVTKYTNCPDEWETEQIENYLYDTLGLRQSDTYYMADAAIPFLKEEYVPEEPTKAKEMAKQWDDLKRKHPDALLLFRCGDFYEAYNDDATQMADVLHLNVTSNATVMVDKDGNPARLSAFPYHALDCYLPKLIRSGCRIAICDNLK